MSRSQLADKVDSLQKQLLAIVILPGSSLSLSTTCHSQHYVSAADMNDESEILHKARAAAEVFRHATHIFLYRVLHHALVPPSSDIQNSIDMIFKLLSQVPESLGPGSMLGWALTVVGSELDDIDRRDYIRGRFFDLQQLHLNGGELGIQVLQEVWRRRDLLHSGATNDHECDWQSVMKLLGINCALF
jgi:hypothetical protein